MNRADRLRRVAPGATDDAVSALAALPAEQVALIASFARAARRDALTEAADRKRQRRADDRQHGNYDENDLTKRNLAVIASQGKRAQSGSIDALTALGQVRDHVDTWIRWAVEGCRSEGYSDAEIGAALGITRQGVGQKYGRKHPFTSSDQPEQESHHA